MWKIIRDLTASPGAEKNPSAWLTRLYAHIGVGTPLYIVWISICWVILAKFSITVTQSAGVAFGLASLTYALVEAYELYLVGSVRRNKALYWDSVLDWVGVTNGAAMAYFLWLQNWQACLALVASALIIAEIGVRVRQRVITTST